LVQGIPDMDDIKITAVGIVDGKRLLRESSSITSRRHAQY